jgi:hypothetical protein
MTLQNKGITMKLFICCVTYYGEYRPDTEPRVLARDADHAIEKARVWCSGMNQSALEICAYPYFNGFEDETDDDHGLTHADRAQFYGPSVRI